MWVSLDNFDFLYMCNEGRSSSGFFAIKRSTGEPHYRNIEEEGRTVSTQKTAVRKEWENET
jgi:hypothetical protein